MVRLRIPRDLPRGECWFCMPLFTLYLRVRLEFWVLIYIAICIKLLFRYCTLEGKFKLMDRFHLFSFLLFFSSPTVSDGLPELVPATELRQVLAPDGPVLCRV